ncbi:MAG TPA: PAS domain S-box protein [Candidatus Acidoferrales bacterium]|nr:PAS domain S-box protein [Candidatus Acidoferrales bacterium]
MRQLNQAPAECPTPPLPRPGRRHQNHALRQERAFLTEFSADAIIGCSAAGAITAWNRAAERIYGYPAGEAAGRPISLLAPSSHGGEIARIMARVAGGASVADHETVHKRKDGALIHVVLSLAPIRGSGRRIDRICAIARDITALRHARDIARHALDQYHHLLESVPCGIFCVDPMGKLLYANRALARILAYASVRDLYQLDLQTELFHDSLAFADFLSRETRFGESRGMQAQWRRSDKTPIRVRLTSRIIASDRKELVAYEVFVEDVSL